MRAVPRWKIELRASTYPAEVWVGVMDRHERWMRFLDREEAEDAVQKLRQVQPHAVYRITGI